MTPSHIYKRPLRFPVSIPNNETNTLFNRVEMEMSCS